MTNKEAIERLKDGAPFSEIYNKEWEEAISLAIQALEEKSTDEWAKVTEAHEDIGFDKGFRDGYAYAVEERTDEWIGDTDYESYQGNYEAYKCNRCGYDLHWRDYHSNKYNFCPNCGAKMK